MGTKRSKSSARKPATAALPAPLFLGKNLSVNKCWANLFVANAALAAAGKTPLTCAQLAVKMAALCPGASGKNTSRVAGHRRIYNCGTKAMLPLFKGVAAGTKGARPLSYAYLPGGVQVAGPAPRTRANTPKVAPAAPKVAVKGKAAKRASKRAHKAA